MKFISDDEIVGRALFEPDWDESVRRLTPSAFTGNATSVTRELGDEDTLIDLLKQDVEKGKVIVKAVGLVAVKTIKKIGLESKESKTYFEVCEDPTELNPNHAEITPFSDEQKSNRKKAVSRGISKKIILSLDLLILDAQGDVVERIESNNN